MEIENLVGKLPVHKTSRYGTRGLAGLRAHVIHHTATGDTLTPYQCALYHVNSNNWPGIAYTYWIAADGKISLVNDLTTMSAGVYAHNDIYLSTVLVGSFISGRKPTDAQIRALNWLHNEHIPTVVGRVLPVLGHKECLDAATACPGVWDWKAAVATPEPSKSVYRTILLFDDGTWEMK